MSHSENLQIFVFDEIETKDFIDSLTDIDQQIVADAIASLIPRWEAVNSDWIKRLPDGLLQLRIGPTRRKVLERLEVREPPGFSNARLLVRVYFAIHETRPVLLCAYDKGADSARATQQRIMALARARQGNWAKGLDN
jgi:putative component of toxin-antitoxin plasmid stabilization module